MQAIAGACGTFTHTGGQLQCEAAHQAELPQEGCAAALHAAHVHAHGLEVVVQAQNHVVQLVQLVLLLLGDAREKKGATQATIRGDIELTELLRCGRVVKARLPA